LFEELRNLGDGLKMWNVGDFVWTNKSLIHGYI